MLQTFSWKEAYFSYCLLQSKAWWVYSTESFGFQVNNGETILFDMAICPVSRVTRASTAVNMKLVGCRASWAEYISPGPSLKTLAAQCLTSCVARICFCLASTPASTLEPNTLFLLILLCIWTTQFLTFSLTWSMSVDPLWISCLSLTAWTKQGLLLWGKIKMLSDLFLSWYFTLPLGTWTGKNTGREMENSSSMTKGKLSPKYFEMNRLVKNFRWRSESNFTQACLTCSSGMID